MKEHQSFKNNSSNDFNLKYFLESKQNLASHLNLQLSGFGSFQKYEDGLGIHEPVKDECASIEH